MKISIFVLTLLSSLHSFGQNKETVFYDSDWNISQPNQAEYFREYISYDESSKTWKIRSCFMNGNIQWEGFVSNYDPNATNCKLAKCQGRAIWFDKNGKKTSEKNYINGTLNGTAFFYNNTGEIMNKLNFKNGSLITESDYSSKTYSVNQPQRTYRKTYDYSISGYGNSNSVYGDITVDKQGGDGYIYDEDGNEKLIDVEWIGNGTLEGYDEDGNYYELEVDY